MNGYVLERTDGLWVARRGHPASYTNKLQNARVFITREAAEADRCVENERIVPVEDLLPHHRD